MNLNVRTPHIIEPDKVKDFMLAGKAILTFQSSASGRHFTYRIEKHKEREVWFVQVLSSLDNLRNYTYIGTLRRYNHSVVFKPAKTVSSEAESVLVYRWVIDKIKRSLMDVLAKMVIQHEGYCCKCGLMLTHPESITLGIGPTCRSK